MILSMEFIQLRRPCGTKRTEEYKRVLRFLSKDKRRTAKSRGKVSATMSSWKDCNVEVVGASDDLEM